MLVLRAQQNNVIALLVGHFLERSLIQRPHNSEELISRNATTFLRLDLLPTLIRHKNGAFRKRSSNRGNLKTLALRFRVDGKHFKYGVFQKR